MDEKRRINPQNPPRTIRGRKQKKRREQSDSIVQSAAVTVPGNSPSEPSRNGEGGEGSS